MKNNEFKIPQISIIVPVYNAELYLDECIKSILNQSFSDFELILVDDGSVDKSWKICDKYRETDDRITVIHIVNGGVSNARNTALKIVKGEFVCFVDSDDTVDVKHLENFIKNLTPEINLYIQQIIIENNGKQKSINYNQYGIVQLKDALQINCLSAHGYACGKLYRTSLIKMHNIEFDSNVKFSEDLLFVLKFSLYSDKIFYINFYGYHYYLHIGSATSKIYTIDLELYCFNSYINTLNEISEKYSLDVLSIKSVTEIYAMLFARVRNSIYENNNGLFSTQRLTFFRNLSKQELKIIYDNRHISNLIIQIAYWFLAHRKYLFFDLIVRNALYIQNRLKS